MLTIEKPRNFYNFKNNRYSHISLISLDKSQYHRCHLTKLLTSNFKVLKAKEMSKKKLSNRVFRQRGIVNKFI